MKILALDLGNFKSVACDYDTQGTKVEYETIVSSQAALRVLLLKRQPERVVIEICPLAGWVCDLVRELGIEIQVAGTNEQRSRWRNVKRKSDRRDALKLAQRSALGELKLVHVPERPVRQWRALINYRQQLVRRRTKIKNHLRALLLRENLSWARGKSGWTQEALEKLVQLAQPLRQVAAAELWRGELQIELEALKSVQRVAPASRAAAQPNGQSRQARAAVTECGGSRPPLSRSAGGAV